MSLRHYDLVLGIGTACSCTQCLRAAGLQHLSFPYDWMSPSPNRPDDCRMDLRRRIDDFVDGFPEFLRRENLEYIGRSADGKNEIYLNRKTRIIHNHDFRSGIPFDMAYQEASETYRRRINRILRLIGKSKRVLIVRIDRPDQSAPTPVEDCAYAIRRLAGRFPDIAFELLLLSYAKGVEPSAGIRGPDECGIMTMTFDYRDYAPGRAAFEVVTPIVAAVLKAHFAVRDYRTFSERRKMKQRRIRCKIEAGNASSYLHYRWLRCLQLLKRHWDRISP